MDGDGALVSVCDITEDGIGMYSIHSTAPPTGVLTVKHDGYAPAEVPLPTATSALGTGLQVVLERARRAELTILGFSGSDLAHLQVALHGTPQLTGPLEATAKRFGRSPGEVVVSFAHLPYERSFAAAQEEGHPQTSSWVLFEDDRGVLRATLELRR